jgi:hypothetical protein
MKQLPDILTSATFWAAVGTLWAASGAWFTYVAAAVSSRQQTYEGILSLVEGLDVELELISEWASGGDKDEGYPSKASKTQLAGEHLDWFNPSRSVFTFDTPVLNNVTNSPYAKSLAPAIRPLVRLNHSIRRLFDTMGRYQTFVMGSPALYQSVLPKFAISPYPSKIGLTAEEEVYVNFVFMMNLSIHQGLIGGADSTDEGCLYKTFRAAREALRLFKGSLKREPLPDEFWILHVIAGGLALVGLWQVMRWFGVL